MDVLNVLIVCNILPNDLSSNYPLYLCFKTLASNVFFIGNKFFFSKPLVLRLKFN